MKYKTSTLVSEVNCITNKRGLWNSQTKRELMQEEMLSGTL